MGHIAFAAPGIGSYHLHERLRRELLQNGHRTHVLCLDPAAHTFWRCQGGDVTVVGETTADAMRAPLAELADRECARRGLRPNDPRHRGTHTRCRQRLARLLPNLVRWFETSRPDLVLLHQERTAEHALVHFVARESGIRVLWTGAGLLPHTLQTDERGLDGDAASCRRPPADYRVVRSEPSLLEACLTNMLARTAPSALTRRNIVVPPLGQRCADAARALLARDLGACHTALSGWRLAMHSPRPDPVPADLPAPPFVALLLQEPDDDRVRLDHDDPPTQRELLLAAAAATHRLDPTLALVVVLPRRGIDHRLLADLPPGPRLLFARPHAAPEVAATALATITANHPYASAALLAGTPVVHTGRALYGLHGTTTATTTAGMTEALQASLAKDHATLRRRHLSWLFGHGHVWCSPTDPDHNGLAGLVQAIESRLQERPPRGLRMQYRAGPAWPLTAEGRGH